MLSEVELRTLLGDMETDRVERTVSHAKTFDALPCLEASLSDLDEERFKVAYRRKAIAEEVIAENGRSLRVQLASLRFFDLSVNCPTYAGILLFNDKPTYYLPGAYVQFVRFDGTERTDNVISEYRVEGDLASVLRELDLLINVNIHQRPVFVTTLREEMRADYPKVAIRELILNAVMHRSYQSNTPIRFYWFNDHIEISNAGGLYGEATAEHFPEFNTYRNPVIAESMRVLGYVNRYGQGIMRAQKALAVNGNPPAQFKFDAYWFTVNINYSPNS